jgi:hypothetical protein
VRGHLVQQPQTSVRLGNQSGMEGADGRHVTAQFEIVCARGWHTSTTRMP